MASRLTWLLQQLRRSGTLSAGVGNAEISAQVKDKSSSGPSGPGAGSRGDKPTSASKAPRVENGRRSRVSWITLPQRSPVTRQVRQRRIRVPHSYIDPTLLLPRAWWVLPLQWLVLGIAAAADAANFYVALATNEASMSLTTLWMAVAALTTLAVVSMHCAGITVRRRAESNRGALIGLGTVGLVAVWLGLGASAFCFRLSAPSDTGSALGAGGIVIDGVAAAPVAEGGDYTHLFSAVMMLSLYLATGAVAAWYAYHHHNPYYAALQRARRLLEREARAKVLVENWVARDRDHLEVVEKELAREDERHREAVSDAYTRAAELKQLVRVQLANALADPASTSALLSTDLPRPRTPLFDEVPDQESAAKPSEAAVGE